MQKRTKLQQQLLIATCAAAIGTTAGCRSAMPKWNLFGSRSTPSAETLAGQGPTNTYPAPPSKNASPMAIASIAGGTAESSPKTSIASASNDNPVTGFDTAARQSAAAGPSTNLSAAAANGFALASGKSTSAAAQLPSYGQPGAGSRPDPNATIPAVPAGYQFGDRKTSPDAASTKTASSAATWNSGTGKYRVPSSYAMPEPADAPPPPSGYAMPSQSMPSVPNQGADSTAPATPASPGGFALPSAGLAEAATPAAAKPFTPKSDSMATAQLSPPSDNKPAAQAKGFALPQSGSTPASTASTGTKSASFSTASATLTPRPTPPTESQQTTVGGYAPGSTSVSGGYPATSGYPGTGNTESFYR